MNPEHKKYILENIGKKTVQDIASALHLKEKVVRRFLEKEAVRDDQGLSRAEKGQPEKKVAQRKSMLIISACLITILVICAFAPSLKNGFIDWDDPEYVTENSYISRISLANIKVLLTTAFVGTYQPVVNLTYLLERHFFGLNAAFYHATNLLLHLLNCLLVFYLVFLWDSNVFVALMAALLFGLHPLRVESVAWVSERKDVLYSFFFLWALVDYCRYIKNNAGKYYYRSFFLFLLALGSKAVAAILPLVFFAVDYLFKRKFDKKLILEKVPFFALSFLFGLIAIVAQGKALHLGHGEPFAISRQITAPLYGIVMYLYKTVFPAGLSLIYPYPPNDAGFYLTCLLSAILISLIAGAAIISRSFTRKITFALLFTFITILPVLQFIPIGNAIMADRYTYLPSIGIFYIASVGSFYLYSMKHRYGLLLKVVLIVFLAGIITAFSILTYNRTRVWKDSITIFSDVVKKYPGACQAYNNRGLVYENQGDFDRAISDYTKAVEIDPGFAEAYYNLGNCYSDAGKKDLSITAFKKAIKLRPYYPEAYNNLATVYFELGKTEEAIGLLETAINLKADYAEAYKNLGIAYRKINKDEEASKMFKKAIELGYAVDPRYL